MLTRGGVVPLYLCGSGGGVQPVSVTSAGRVVIAIGLAMIVFYHPRVRPGNPGRCIQGVDSTSYYLPQQERKSGYAVQVCAVAVGAP